MLRQGTLPAVVAPQGCKLDARIGAVVAAVESGAAGQVGVGEEQWQEGRGNHGGHCTEGKENYFCNAIMNTVLLRVTC